MAEAKKILLIGAGGHCQSVLDSILTSQEYSEIGIIDKQKTGYLLGTPIIGTDDELSQLFLEGYSDAFITVGSIGDVSLRKKLYQRAKSIGFHIPNIIDKSSVVSNYAFLGEGIFIGKKAVVNAGATLGNCSIINTSSIIEHDCIIRDFVHISPGSILSGSVQVGDNSHIGAGSVIKQGVQIGACCMIGMGSVVLKDISEGVTAYGNPCKEQRSV